MLGPGTFTGEINQLSGRRSLVRCQALEASELLEIDRASLRRIMQSDAAIGEIFLRAFVMRRVYLIANSVGDAILIGSSHSGDTLRLRAFLSRNGHPHTYLDVEHEPDIQTVLDHFAIGVADIPVLICRGDVVLRNPTNAEAAACFGLNAGIDETHDVRLDRGRRRARGTGRRSLWRIGRTERSSGGGQCAGRASRREFENRELPGFSHGDFRAGSDESRIRSGGKVRGEYTGGARRPGS